MAEIPLPLAGFFGKNMAQVLFFILYLASPGERITLGGALFSLHLRHDAILCLFFRLGAQYHGHKPAFHGRGLIHHIFPFNMLQDIFKDV
jgi:hypothetical protein